jgi:uncharacterized protein (TIGR02001 family)
MARRSREAGIVKACVLGAALAVALTMPAQAQNKLALSGSATITTDYVFRGTSLSNNGPAVQPEFDLTYGMFYAGMWGSNINPSGDGIEIDYYAGITPKWKDITFNIGGLEYTYPGATDLDYFELKTGATWASGPWSVSVTNYWSPDNFQLGTQSDAIEGGVGYTFGSKLFNFFTPTISGLVGYQGFEHTDILPDYTYWNAGLTLGFLEHWSADVRYWDTTYNEAECFTNTGVRSACDARVVGTIKATF